MKVRCFEGRAAAISAALFLRDAGNYIQMMMMHNPSLDWNIRTVMVTVPPFPEAGIFVLLGVKKCPIGRVEDY
jgi:hypothetical protein